MGKFEEEGRWAAEAGMSEVAAAGKFDVLIQSMDKLVDMVAASVSVLDILVGRAPVSLATSQCPNTQVVNYMGV